MRWTVYNFHSNKSYVFRKPYMPVCFFAKFDSIASTLVRLLPPPLSFPLPPFVTLLLSPDLCIWVEGKLGEVREG